MRVPFFFVSFVEVGFDEVRDKGNSTSAAGGRIDTRHQQMNHALLATLKLVKHHTGIVVPVYLPSDEKHDAGAALLRDTVRAFADLIDDPGFVCLSVDGTENGMETAQQLGDSLGVSVVGEAENRGKLQGMIGGTRELLGKKDIKYLAVVDQDGDHFANELPNFVRAAEHILSQTGSKRVLVNGGRTSRHRPMGFLRGELEEFADRVLLEMLRYRAAAKGTPLDLRFAGTTEEFPDFHSGYKLYNRRTAEEVFGQDPDLCGCARDAGYRHGCEAVAVVQSLESGAIFGQVMRSTFNRQPVSTFESLDIVELVSDKMIWPARRLEIPATFIRQWMLNCMPGLSLQTLLPQGAGTLGEIFRRVMEELDPDGSHRLPADEFSLFV